MTHRLEINKKMKNNYRHIFSWALLPVLFFCFSFMPDDKQAAQKITVVQPYLGYSDYTGGLITKRTFDSLLKQGIKAKDSAGNYYQVTGFTFGYGERNLYEDSVGKLMIITDYVTEYCSGDTLTASLQQMIFTENRTKARDTAYIDRIKVANPEGKTLDVKNMRFIVTK